MEQTTLTLTLVVRYNLHGAPVQELKDNLRHMLGRAIGDGLLSNNSPAEVDAWASHIIELG